MTDLRTFPAVFVHPSDRAGMRNGSTAGVRATVARLAAQAFPWTETHTEARLSHVKGQLFELVTWSKAAPMGTSGTIVARMPLRTMREWLLRRLRFGRCA